MRMSKDPTGAEPAAPYLPPVTSAEQVIEREPGSFDAVLVLVHGMGPVKRSEMLLSWAEPLLNRMDWIARDARYGADERCGVSLIESDLAEDPTIITATVTFPRNGAVHADATTNWLPGPLTQPDDFVTRRIAMLEARWSGDFPALGRGDIFQWALPFLWRVVARMLRHFWRTIVALAWLTLMHRRDIPSRDKALPVFLDVPVAAIRVVVYAAFFAAVAVAALGIAAVLTPLLPLTSPLLLIPAVQRAAQATIERLDSYIGDVAAWKERPARATAMRVIVRNTLSQAAALGKPGSDLHVLAHSQGSAVSALALFEEGLANEFGVTHFTSVGSAIVLMGRDTWRGRPDPYHPVANWCADGNRNVVWRNYWAIWDLFAAGPIADDRRLAGERWKAAYFPALYPSRQHVVSPAVPGPEEHAVFNTSQPFLDHQTYNANVVQVVDPTARALLGPELPALDPQIRYLEDRLSVIGKKSLGLNLLAAAAIGVLLPTLPVATQCFAALASVISRFVGIVGAWLAAISQQKPPTADPFGALYAPGRDAAPLPVLPDLALTTFGWIVASALVFALLAWLNQMLNTLMEDSRTWNRAPIRASWWLFWTAIPRVAYTGGALVVFWFVLWRWGGVSGLPAWVCWLLAVAFAIVGMFVVAEPRVAPSPVPVPADPPHPEPGPGALATSAQPWLHLRPILTGMQGLARSERGGLGDPSPCATDFLVRRALRVRPAGPDPDAGGSDAEQERDDTEARD